MSNFEPLENSTTRIAILPYCTKHHIQQPIPKLQKINKIFTFYRSFGTPYDDCLILTLFTHYSSKTNLNLKMILSNHQCLQWLNHQLKFKQTYQKKIKILPVLSYRVSHGKLGFSKLALRDRNVQVRFLEGGFKILRFEKFWYYNQFL